MCITPPLTKGEQGDLALPAVSENLNLFDLVPERSLPAHHQLVWAFVSGHKGKANAVSLPDVAQHCGYNRRTIQDIVHRLVEDHGLPVASTSSNRQPGYYIPADSRESLQHFRSIFRRSLQVMKRARAFYKSPQLAELLGQAELLCQEGKTNG